MNTYPALTNIRSHLSHQFLTQRTNALRDSRWAKLTGKTTQLAIFPGEATEKSRIRNFIGTAVIPMERIVGTLSKHSDFDHKFRPLNKHLRDRWINVYLTLARDGWSPIVVHKAGDDFYVEDGHHRVSIARALGMTFIEAEVWEHPIKSGEQKECQPEPCPEWASV